MTTPRLFASQTIAADVYSGSLAVLNISLSPLVHFLEFYDSNALIFQNLFTIFTTIVLLHSLELKSSERETRLKVLKSLKEHKNDVPSFRQIIKPKSKDRHIILDNSQRKNIWRLQRRATVTTFLLGFTVIMFLSNLFILVFDDRIYDSNTATFLNTNSATSISFATGPYYVLQVNSLSGNSLNSFLNPSLISSISTSSSPAVFLQW